MCISRLYSPIIQIGRAAAASVEIFAVLDAKVPDTTGLKAPDVQINDIVFRDVTFAYPKRPDITILDGLNLRFERGKTTAIVGPSGSGKSTIVSLLERWYEPAGTIARTPSSEDVFAREVEIFEKAEKMVTPWPIDTRITSGIYIGGTNLKDIDVKWWRSHVGLVQQEPFLFNDTIFNNVANGLAGTKWENAPKEQKVAMVENACREAFADEFISRLPSGYDTMVGESGMKMSGGQRQRIAIARAIVKEPEILILDEATSSIDVRTEKIVQAALDRVSNNRTTIAIAHRLSTIKKADHIIVIRAGKLAEEGTHEELLQRDGVYAGFVRAQAVELGQEDVDSIENIHDYDTVDMKDEATNHLTAQSGEPREPEYKQRAFLSSFGLLVYEQRSRWLLYTLLVLGAMGGGGKCQILTIPCVERFD
jgi:ATP-binding cassette, subfamily B (MDR/TAP), member 1